MKKTSTNSNNENSADDFYEDLDKKREHGSCCTFQSLIILFFIILIIALGFVLYLYFQIKSGGLFNSSKVNISISSVQDRLKNLKTVGDQVEFSFNNEELAAILDSGISADDFILQDLTTNISSENAIFYGNLVKPMSTKIIINTKPEIIDGKVIFKVENTKTGNVNLFSFLNKTIESRLNENFTNKMSLFYTAYRAESVKLEQNKLIINGRKK